jgi:hypothetical protein
MRESPAHADDSIDESERVFCLRFSDIPPGEGHAQSRTRLARGSERLLEAGRLVSLAAVGPLAQSECDTGAAAFELLGERAVMASDNRDERLETGNELECDFVDFEFQVVPTIVSSLHGSRMKSTLDAPEFPNFHSVSQQDPQTTGSRIVG